MPAREGNHDPIGKIVVALDVSGVILVSAKLARDIQVVGRKNLMRP